MTKKFTEEQYQEIIKAWGSEAGYVKGIQAVVDYLSSIEMSFMVDEAVALANPRTRLGAHEQFVEKEKKYVWTSKKPYCKDFYKRLYMASDGLSKNINGIGIASYEKLNVSEDEYLTETEVRKNGYDPEWFDKEEV